MSKNSYKITVATGAHELISGNYCIKFGSRLY